MRRVHTAAAPDTRVTKISVAADNSKKRLNFPYPGRS